MASSSSSSSSSKRRRSYDVFLSFRGTDVRNYFLGHLYTALVQSGINTYMDSEDLKKGEQISPALMEAIEESQIAIIVFSKDYASSPWCLEEVAKIMECKEQRGLMVFPVFYKVEPREVRGQRQGYAEAMAKHEVKFGEDSEKVKRWKKALLDAGSLSGCHFMDGYEAGLIQDIIQEISTQLDRTPLDVATYPVGMDSRVLELKTILNLQSKDDVLMVGLWGQGGVGKTTLAKAIYNAIFKEFQVSSFLECVRENSKSSNDLVPLQVKLLSELTPRRKLMVFNVGGGSRLIQERLCNKKVLIILDDVDDERQLNALARDREWFAKGSRIIITTRDKHLLTYHGVDHIYEVKTLEDGEALELFRSHAFRRNQKIEIRSNLVDSVLHYAKGLPLPLEVLGSFLCGRGEHEWKSTLQKLTKSTNKKINDVLKVSYDGLEDNEKDIFLDIACFLKGHTTEYIKKVLDGCDFDTTIGVQILIERSLISEEKGYLHMHDLMQAMGIDIVKEESRDDPSQRSRLWLHDDVFYVLSGDVGTSSIKAIVLELPKPEETYICPNAFTNMRNLRLLILRNVDTSFQGPIHLPNELRWLEWTNCSTIPEFGYGPNKLVGPDMQNGKIKQVPGQFKDFNKLKFITLIQCQSLICTPNISCTPNLEKLYLESCKNLKRVHESIACHGKLWSLSLRGCSNLQSFPDILVKNEALLEVFLIDTGIEELPASIENLVSLKRMYLVDSKKLAILPSSIYRLQNLEILQLSGCSRPVKFPKEEEEDLSERCSKMRFPMLSLLSLGWCHLSEVEFMDTLSSFPRLRELDLQGNNFTDLPSCWKLYNLEGLDVSNCQQLQEIPKLPKNLRRLRATSCKSLSRLPSKICDVEQVELYSSQEVVRHGAMNDYYKFEDFRMLKDINFKECNFLTRVPDLSWAPNLERLNLSFCESLVEVDQSVGYLDKLEFLSLYACSKLSIFPSILETKSLRELHLSSCSKLDKFPNILVKIEHLEELNLEGTAIKELPASIDNLVSIRQIILRHCKSLIRLPSSIYKLQNLEHLNLNYCSNFIMFPKNLEDPTDLDGGLGFPNLDSISLQDCNLSGLDFLEDFSNFPKLRRLDLDGNKFTHMPRCFHKYDNLKYLYLDNCQQLQEIPLLPSNIGIIRANNCRSLQKLPDFSSLSNFSDVNFSSCCGLSRKGFDLAGVSILEYLRKTRKLNMLLIGGEMPGWIHNCEEGPISFKVPKDLYDKFLGLALCVVLGLEEGKVVGVSCEIQILVNGKSVRSYTRCLHSLESDHVWLEYYPRSSLWEVEKYLRTSLWKVERYLQNDWSHFQVHLRLSKGSIKKCGFRLICQQQEDDLRVEPQCPHPIEID